LFASSAADSFEEVRTIVLRNRDARVEVENVTHARCPNHALNESVLLLRIRAVLLITDAVSVVMFEIIPTGKQSSSAAR
jgi:hypothetical protein